MNYNTIFNVKNFKQILPIFNFYFYFFTEMPTIMTSTVKVDIFAS